MNYLIRSLQCVSIRESPDVMKCDLRKNFSSSEKTVVTS